MSCEITEYIGSSGESLFREWFYDLDAIAAAKVTAAIARLENGNVSNVKSLGSGVHELKINFGPGYRVYFAYEGKNIIILLGGGSKRRQSKDIEIAKIRWAHYKSGKK
jgi:putative addiction module killer protein